MADAGVESCRRALIAAVIAAQLAMLLLPPLLDFAVSLSGVSLFAIALLAAGALSGRARRPRLRALRTVLEVTGLSALLVAPILVLTYAAVRVGMPLADGALIAADRALGFDWPAWLRLVDSSPALAALLGRAYDSFTAQLLLVPILLAALGRHADAYRFVLSFFLLCALASLVSVFFPCQAAFVGHGFDPTTLRNVDAHYGTDFLASFEAARSDPRFVLDGANAGGILTFPSVHAGMAVLCARGAWPSVPMRLAFVPINVLMFVSALTHGGHYLVDIVAGALAALLAIKAAAALSRLAGPREPAADAPLAAPQPA